MIKLPNWAFNMKNFLKENWLKLLVAGVLIGALWNHPYSYYQFLRWITTIGSGYLAYKYAQTERFGWMWIFISLAILFNPIAPFYLQKETWQKFNLIGAVIFLISVFHNSQRK